MDLSYEKIELTEDQSFYIGVFQDTLEKSVWHYHHKLEVNFITEGIGRRIVGDSIENFSPGDLVFIGAKLPHVWMSQKDEFGSPTSRSLESVYLQFGKEVLPKEILKLPELKNVKKALALSGQGMRITGKTLNTVSNLMLKLPYIDNFRRMVYLYEILDAIGRSNSNIMLASKSYVKKQFSSNNDRITRIHEFLMSRYTEQINLEQIADLVHLAPGSLCRFFKNETGITIFDYLNKIKIDYACSLLLNQDMSITDIAYDCGFNNLSHFNRQFKKLTMHSPSQYRKLHNASML